nr:hypothetical protein [Tanacetum cinerariifolium]
MDVEVEKDDLNQKFLTSLAPEWMMHTIVWRNMNDLDTMSLDDLYNHLKVYEAKVKTKSNSNSHNMAFISSSKNSSGNEDNNIACVSTASTTYPTGSVNVAIISQDTANAYIASQSNDKFLKRTGKKISIQGSDVVGFDKSKVECFNCHKMGHFARECRAPISLERRRKESYGQWFKTEEKTLKALMAIDGVGWDWSYMANEGEDHALVANGETPIEFALMANTESKVFDNFLCSNDYKELEEVKLEKDGLDGKLIGLLKASKNLDHLIESQRVKKETTRSQKYAYKSPSHRSSGHRPHGDSMRPTYRPAGHRLHGPSMNPRRPTMNVRTQYSAPWVPTINRNNPLASRKFSTGKRNFPTVPTAGRKFTTGSIKNHTTYMGRKGKDVKSSACWTWNPSQKLSNKGPINNSGSSQNNIDEKGYWDSGCSRHMTGNISYFSDFKPFNRGYVSFVQVRCKITGKGTIKTGKLENFKLLDDANILLRTPRQHNMYSIDLNNIVPYKDLTCLVAKASADECTLWHRRLSHLNVKRINKLVRHNLVRRLPTKSFDNDHTCTAFLKGKQHKTSGKS